MFLTIKQIEISYKINRKHIDAAINKGDLQAYQFGGKTKQIQQKDLERWIEKNKYTPKSLIPLVRYKSFNKVKEG